MFEIKQAVAQVRPDLERARCVWLAYSGGLDSTVLLHALVTEGIQVKALHVNHQLSPNADDWERHCVKECTKLRCEIVVERVAVENRGKGVEHAAREARYTAFDRHVKTADILLMAHHLDDECETLLFRLLRGTGLKGFTGIRRERTLIRGGRVMRPLLSADKKAVLGYANQHTLSWVEDESNRNTEFDRNYLRETVLPLFQQRWPNFRKQFSNTVALLRESEQLLSEYARLDLLECEMRNERLGNSVNLTKLMRFSSRRRNHVLREWLEQSGFSLPGFRHLDEVAKMMRAREDAIPVVEFGECELRRYRDRLFCLPRLPAFAPQVIEWQSTGSLSLPDGSILALSEANAGSPLELTVTFRQGSERCKPVGRHHSQTLKKLMQEYELEPWLRQRVPLIYSGGELIAVGDLWVCDTTTPDVRGLKFSWCYPQRGSGRGNGDG